MNVASTEAILNICAKLFQKAIVEIAVRGVTGRRDRRKLLTIAKAFREDTKGWTVDEARTEE